MPGSKNHKRYPDAARQRGEEGRAVLRFSVDRSGRVLDFDITSSSGYLDLDQSIEEMMRNASAADGDIGDDPLQPATVIMPYSVPSTTLPGNR